MTPTHDDVLAEIERQVRTEGTSLDEVDCRIADELGVPHDYYFAYLLVWGAIEAYREARLVADPRFATTADHGPDAALDRSWSLADTIGWLASTTYRQAADLGPCGKEIAGHAAKTLAALLQLRQHLREIDSPGPDASGRGKAVQP